MWTSISSEVYARSILLTEADEYALCARHERDSLA